MTIVSTDYGRNSVDIASRQVIEIMCHAAGAEKFWFPGEPSSRLSCTCRRSVKMNISISA